MTMLKAEFKETLENGEKVAVLTVSEGIVITKMPC